MSSPSVAMCRECTVQLLSERDACMCCRTPTTELHILGQEHPWGPDRTAYRIAALCTPCTMAVPFRITAMSLDDAAEMDRL